MKHLLLILLGVVALCRSSMATEWRLSTAEVEAYAPISMAGIDTLTIHGEQTHDLLDLVDLELASGLIRFEALDLTNSSVISSTLTINQGSTLILDGVRTENSSINFTAAGGRMEIRNCVLGSSTSSILIDSPLSQVEIESSAICRSPLGINLQAGELIVSNSLFLTNTLAMKVDGGTLTSLANVSFQGCETSLLIGPNATVPVITHCDFTGARTFLVQNQSADTLEFVDCHIDDPSKVYGPHTITNAVAEPWRPLERPILIEVSVEEVGNDVPLSALPSDYTENGYPYVPSAFKFCISTDPYAFDDAECFVLQDPTTSFQISPAQPIFVNARVLIGEWVAE